MHTNTLLVFHPFLEFFHFLLALAPQEIPGVVGRNEFLVFRLEFSGQNHDFPESIVANADELAHLIFTSVTLLTKSTQ